MNEGTKSAPSLRSRILSATLWTLILRVLARVLGIVTTLFVARTVPQSQLGIYAILLIADGAVQALTAFGFDSAVIQMREEPTAAHINTSWTSNLIRGSLIFVIEIAIAPYWCDFFNVPEAVGAMRTLALAPLILGLQSPSTVVLTRAMRFDRTFFTYASETLSSSVATIIACWIRPDITGVLIGYLTGFTVRVIVTYLVHPIRPRFGIDLGKAREMFHYSKWLFAFSISDFALETTDNAITGRVFGKVPLARYRMAYQMAMEGPVFLQWVVTRVAFPTFASVQVKPDSLRENFRALLALVATTMIPASLAIAAFSEPIVVLLLGPSWAPAAVPLRILSIAALVRSIIDVAPPILRGLGRTRADFILKVAQVCAMCALLYPAAKALGIEGVAWAVVIGAIAVLPLWVLILARAARISTEDFLMPIAAPIAAGLAAAAVFAALPAISPSWPGLIAEGLAVAAAYLGASAILYRLLPRSGASAVIHGTGA